MKTYNDIYMTARTVLRQHGVEAYNLEARILVAQAAGKTVPDLLRDLVRRADSGRLERGTGEL